MYKIVITIITIAIVFKLYEAHELKIKVSEGIIKGKYWESRKGRSFLGFTGIPFAKPPVGELRFKPPIPVTPWTGVLDASKPHNACPQISIYLKGNPILGNEDCLYLNVYTPQLNQSILPVMFYIHGGSFTMGSARNDWLGPEILLDKDVVLVTTNYRLGSLGFLSTSDDVVSGNNGLKDQSLALKWVKRNIASFGGDPNKITIFGNSAGAISVQLHMYSPLTRNLINGAIAQSGPAFLNYVMTTHEDGVKNAKFLADSLNCTTTTTLLLVQCLRSLDVDSLLLAEFRIKSWDNDTIPIFLPTIELKNDEAYLYEHPKEGLKSGNVANVPLMIGIAAQECAYKTADLNNKSLLSILDKDFNTIIPSSFGITLNEYYTKEIRKFYFGDEEITEEANTGLTNMYSDGLFLRGHDIAMKLHKEYFNNSIYQYLFNYRGSTSYSTLFGNAVYDYGGTDYTFLTITNSEIKCVSHTDELLYLFKLGMTFPNYKPTENDEKVSDLLTSLWSNFATTGKPTSGHFEQSKWNPIESDNLEYYDIRNYNHTVMSERLYWKRAEFWRNITIGE